MILYTERLVLRPWKETDAESLFEYAKDPSIGATAGWPPHADVEVSRAVIRSQLSSPETFAVCLKEEGKPIGSFNLKFKGDTDLTDADDEVEMGAWIGKEFWNKGYISEAGREVLRHCFEDLNLSKVWAAYYDGNNKSGHVLESYGLTYDHMEKNVFVPLVNELHDVHVLSITKETWESIRTRRNS
ncbi:MAG: GNAT family N-acetyltransferase [Lachnospiraceae bacterium]|nr:GNAT family N-acetyltransferase [Lachnospiraceae bacterium]